MSGGPSGESVGAGLAAETEAAAVAAVAVAGPEAEAAPPIADMRNSDKRWEDWGRNSLSSRGLSREMALDLDAKLRLACPELFQDEQRGGGEVVEKGQEEEEEEAPSPLPPRRLPPNSTRSLYSAHDYSFISTGVSTQSMGGEGQAPHPEEADKGWLCAFLRWMSPLIAVAKAGSIGGADIWPSPRAAGVRRNANRIKLAWQKEQRKISSKNAFVVS
jgi:hypothetical protein